MKNLLLLFLLFFSLTAFADSKKKAVTYDDLDEKSRLEFDYSFMEAVRHKITGDLNTALRWFDSCLNYYQSPAVQYEIANILLIKEDLNSALHFARQSVEGDPANIWYQLLLAAVLQKKAMIDEAGNVYSGIISTHPDREEFYLVEGNLYTSVEKWQKAIDVYDRYEKQFGITEPVSFEKMKLYTKINNNKAASEELIKLIDKYPDNSEYLSLLAEFYFSDNQDKKGLNILNKLLKKDPGNGLVHLYLADYFVSKKELAEADVHIRKAFLNDELDSAYKLQYLLQFALSPDTTLLSSNQLSDYILLLREKYDDDLSIRAIYSDFLKKENKLKESRAELEFILSKEKDNYLIWEELLLLCNELMDTVCMYQTALECMEYFPEQPLPYVFSGISLVLQEKYNDAISFFQAGLKISDENLYLKSQFYSYLGDCYYRLDSIDQAFLLFEQALEINPDDYMLLNNYAYYLSLLKKDLDKAERMSMRTIVYEPDNSTYLDTYAWILFEQKSYSQALYYMKSALENDENPSGVMYEHYGDILYANGQKEEALEMWNKALKIGGDITEDLESKISGTYVFEFQK